MNTARFRIRLQSVSDHDKVPIYYLEERTWLFWWKYVQMHRDKEYLKDVAIQLSTPPEYLDIE